MRQARLGAGWRGAEIQYDALYSPEALATARGMSYPTTTMLHREVGWRVGLSSVAAVFRRRAKGRSSESAGLTVAAVLKAATQSAGLVLVLDEV